MRLEGIRPLADLTGRYRASRRPVETISVAPRHVAEFEAAGWQISQAGRTKVRMQRERPLCDAVELQAWRVMYLCGLHFLSSDGGAKLIRGEGVENQIDVVAYDDNAAVVIECSSSEEGSGRVDVQAELALLNEKRNCVRELLNADRNRNNKLKVAGALVLYNVPFSDVDKRRASEMNLTIFDSSILQYYERLALIIGTATRYQLFGELFRGQGIPSMTLRVPAVEFKMGESKAYSFAMSPANLLKVCFVAHRGRGSIDTYQRMVSKRRLKDIATFIDTGGVFPTNIVVNFQPQGQRGSGLQFSAAAADAEATPGSRLGYLTIPPIYQTAWLIDGQHRLLAYSDHRWAESASLTVTAFDGLSADKQADLFEKINSKQKKVSANLLAELFATLHWQSSDQKLQISAIASQVAQDLRSNTSSPLHRRVLSLDEKSTQLRCITLKEIVTGLQRAGMFVRAEDRGIVRQYGVLWAGGPDASYKRSYTAVAGWFETIKASCNDMWAAGNDENAGLVATNRGVNASLRVLSWVLMYLRKNDPDVEVTSDSELVSRLEPFGRSVGEYFGTLDADKVRAFRRHYGTGAPAEIAYSIGQFIRTSVPDFEPEGLLDWIESKNQIDVELAQRLCTSIERRLFDNIIGQLRREYGDEGWWREIPVQIRREAAARREEEPEDHPLETFLFLIDLRSILLNKWTLFSGIYSIGQGSKEEKTKWLVKLNDIRRRADHAGGARLKAEDLDMLRSIDASLQEQGV